MAMSSDGILARKIISITKLEQNEINKIFKNICKMNNDFKLIDFMMKK
jgi:hypothetical protein